MFGFFCRMHIPGAIHFDIEKASYKTKTVIRELHSVENFQEYVQSLGVNKSSKIIAYDHSIETCGFFSAARAFWLFKVSVFALLTAMRTKLAIC